MNEHSTTQGRVGKAASTPSTRSRGLPPALLAVVPERLGRVTLAYAFAFTMAVTAGQTVAYLLDGRPWEFDSGNASAVVFVSIALITSFVVRSGTYSPERLVNLGLVFMVVGSLGIGIGSHDPHYYWEAVEGDGKPFIIGITWICVWILVYPLVVPSPPRKTLIALLLSAMMGMLALLIWLPIRNVPAPPASVLLQMTVPNFICVALAFMASSIMYRLGHDLGQAQEMGSYRLESLLGSGGMGEVWQARHRMLARPAAIKLIRQDGAAGLDETALRRFELEAQATAGLSSPHTVRLYDFGRTQEGVFYYVMELLDGVDLDTLVRRFGPVPPERAVHLLQSTCLSLAEAHHRGLVHRDIKPTNIYSCRLGLEHDFVKVLDFGLVKSQRSGDRFDTRLTRGDIALGTPAYMAPEMATGSGIDGRADLYALGCVGFWLLTGRDLFEGDTPLQVVMKHAQEEPIPPSSVSEVPIPTALDELLMQCLRKRPEDRPQSAAALADALTSLQLDPPWKEERAARWWDHHLPRRSAGNPA